MLYTEPSKLSQIMKMESISKDFKKKSKNNEERRRSSMLFVKDLPKEKAYDKRRKKKVFTGDDGLPFSSLIEVIVPVVNKKFVAGFHIGHRLEQVLFTFLVTVRVLSRSGISVVHSRR